MSADAPAVALLLLLLVLLLLLLVGNGLGFASFGAEMPTCKHNSKKISSARRKFSACCFCVLRLQLLACLVLSCGAVCPVAATDTHIAAEAAFALFRKELHQCWRNIRWSSNSTVAEVGHH
jgi:hypothetical protein